MRYFSKYFFYFICFGLLIWMGPWLYAFMFSDTQTPLLTLYSSVHKSFITMKKTNNVAIWVDENNNVFSREQADSLLPFFYVRQLIADNRFPDSISGQSFTAFEVNNTNFMFYNSPSSINANLVKLYPLLESQSKRVELTMPNDVFRTTENGIEFIDMASNTINEEKSERFTQVMLAKNFSFPAKYLSGNATTRKDYDEGYLIIDSDNKLFHLKQMVGRPYVKAIELPDNITASNVYITEFRSRNTLGFLSDTENRLYVILADYTIKRVDIPSFNPNAEALTIYGNILDWTVMVKNNEYYNYYAINASDYSLIAQKSIKLDGKSVYGLHFTSSTDKYAYPRF